MSFRISGVTIIGRTLGSASGSPVSTLTATTVVSTVSAVQNAATSAVTPVTATGGTLPYTYAISPSLPVGLSFNTSTGEITGTPVISVLESVYTVTVTDAASATATSSFELEALPAVQSATVLLVSGQGTNGAGNNSYINSSTSGITISENGSVSQGNFSPFNIPNGYWSNYFDGTGDFLKVGSTNAPVSWLNTSGSTGCIEAWVYPTSLRTGSMSNSGGVYTFPSILGLGATYFNFGIDNGTPKFYWWSGVGNTLASSTTISINTWNHIAVVFTGSGSNNLKLYVNGVLSGTATFTQLAWTSADGGNNLYIGAEQSAPATSCWPGYISNIRVVSGNPVYTANFTPSITPLQPITGTTLLAAQSYSFADNSTNAFALTQNGTVQVSAFSALNEPVSTPVMGSAYFPGTSWLGTSSVPALSGTFSVSAWVYMQSGGMLLGDTASDNYLLLGPNGVSFAINTAYPDFPTTVPTNSWVHIAVSRNASNVITVFVNGKSVGTQTRGGTFLQSNFYIGRYRYNVNPNYFVGYFADVRVTNTVEFTTNFPIPTAPSTAVAGTQFLLQFNNAGVLENTNSWNIDTPQSISTAVSKYYGSSLPVAESSANVSQIWDNTPELDLVSGDFTVQLWFYPSDTVGDGGIVNRSNTSIATQNDIQWSIYRDGTTLYARVYQSTTDFTIPVGTCVANQWYHIALVRTGTTVYGYLNGVRSGTVRTVSGNLNNNTSWRTYVGGAGATGGVNGYINDFNIVKKALYTTTTFTPPNPLYTINPQSFYTITSVPLVTATQGTAITPTTPVTALGGTPPYTYTSTTALPSGLSLNAATGAITGTPLLGVTQQSFGITVTDSLSATASGSFMLAVSANYNEYTSLLLDGVGANNAQNNTFVDSGPNNFTVTRTGNATQGSFGPYSTTNWANYFDGTGDFLSTPSTTSLAFGNGNFTIEGWLYPTSTKSYMRFMQFSGDTYNIDLNSGATGKISFYNGSSSIISSGAPVTINAWNHIALVRNNGTINIYVNGVSALSAADSGNITTAQVLNIGGSTNNWFQGYMSNVRVVKGTAVYTSNFVPSTAPLTAVSGTGLLTCQSNRLVDNSTNNFAITRNGDVTVSAFGPFSYNTSYLASTNGGSLYLDGSGDYVSANYSSNSTIAGDFTWETWVYDNGTKAYGTLVGWRNASTGWQGIVVQRNNSQSNIIVSFPTTLISQSTGTYLMKQWNHVAVVRTGSVATLYVNGVNSGSTTLSGSFNPGSNYWIGSDPFNNTSAVQLDGYISNQRFINGTALYTGNFTPPTAPVTAITNTSLLLNFANAGIFDSATQNDTETVGNAKISTAQSKWGGSSMYFDGTGGYLSFPSSMAFDQNVPFTIETWIYPTTGGYFYTQNRSGFFCLSFGSDGKIYVDRSQIAVAITSSGTFALNQWYHVALTYDGTTTRLFVNGNQQGTYNGGGASSGTTLAVGRYLTGTNYFGGYLQGLRVTRGVARYTSTFTPPVNY